MDRYNITEESEDSKISVSSIKMELSETPSPEPSSDSESASEPVGKKKSKRTQLKITEAETPSPTLSVSSTMNESRMRMLDGKFFKYLPEDSTKKIVVALCMKCAPEAIKVRGYIHCSSNFLGHLKRKHGEESVNEYKDYCLIKQRRKWSQAPFQIQDIVTEKRETRSGTIFNSTEEETKELTQDEFDDIIVKYFINSMIPLKVLEDQYFSQIFSLFNIKAFGINLMSVQTLKHRINENYIREITDIKSQLSTINYVCTSIDIWPGEKRNFIGITAHWIRDDLVSVSMALVCREFKSIHINDEISQLIQEINADFGLSLTKVVATIVNSKNSLIKAFKMFGVQFQNINIADNKEDNPNRISTDSEEFEEEDHNILTLPILDSMIISSLPVRLQCCGNTLILCATIDANTVLTDRNTALSNMHNTVLEKCNALWKAASELESAKKIQETLEQPLNRPEATRWNSLYDSLQQILTIKEKNEELHKALNLPNPISKSEFTYIEEYLICAEPITEALDIMQRENNRYYGIVLPCLCALRKKLNKIFKKHKFKYCKPLIKTYIRSVETRFSQFFDLNTPESETAAIAALSYPRFKNTWLSCFEPANRNKVINNFKNIISKQIHQKPERVKKNVVKENVFFNFDSDSDSENVKLPLNTQSSALLIKAELLLLNFFAEDSQELSILDDYPEIKHVFIKYNTALPSSAAVEGLFSYETITKLPNKLSEEMFEKRVILKSNLHYKNK